MLVSTLAIIGLAKVSSSVGGREASWVGWLLLAGYAVSIIAGGFVGVLLGLILVRRLRSKVSEA